MTHRPKRMTKKQAAIAEGDPCRKHGSINVHVVDGKWVCDHCEREAEAAAVELAARQAKDAVEAEVQPPPPFAFITKDLASGAIGSEVTDRELHLIHMWEKTRPEFYQRKTKFPCAVTPRWKLPDERKSLTHHFEIGDEKAGGISAYLHCGVYENYRLGEIFVRAAKQGSYVAGFTDAFAMAVSISLQHGVPLKLLMEKFSHQGFDPSGFVRGSPPELKMCKSVLDYIARFLLLRFPDGCLVPEWRHEAQ
jgi:hypothetical protein